MIGNSEKADEESENDELVNALEQRDALLLVLLDVVLLCKRLLQWVQHRLGPIQRRIGRQLKDGTVHGQLDREHVFFHIRVVRRRLDHQQARVEA